MFKQNIDDDETFFTPQPSSKLASLFGMMGTSSLENPQSLTYAPPKQPSTASLTREKSPTRQVDTSVILVKIVHAYKLVNGAYQTLGKLGFALIGNTEVKYFNLVLYRDKNHPLVNIHVSYDFVITVLENNYLSFFDESQQNWCVLFENDNDRLEFSKQLEECNIKLLKNPKKSDLSEESETFSSSAETLLNSEPTKKHAEDVISDPKLTILKRMAKMGQPILPNSPPSGIDTVSGSDSENEQTVRKSKKTPRPRTSHESSSPNPTSLSTNPIGLNPVMPQQFTLVNGNLYPTNPSLHYINQNSSTNQLITYDHQNTVLSANLSPIISQDLNIFFSENRVHNSEVRMNISKLETKIDSLLTLVQQKPQYHDKKIEMIQIENDALHKKISELQLNQLTLSKDSKSYLTCTSQVDFNVYNDLEKELKELKEINKKLESKSRENEQLIEDYKEKFNLLSTKYSQILTDIDKLKSLVTFQSKKLQVFDDFLRDQLKSIDFCPDHNADFLTFQENIKNCQEKNEEINRNFDSLVRVVDLMKSENYSETVRHVLSSSDQEKHDEFINKANDNLNEVLNMITILETAIISQRSKIEIVSKQKDAIELDQKTKNKFCEKLHEEISDLKRQLSVYEKGHVVSKQMLDDMLVGNIKEEMNLLYAQLSNFIPEDYCDRMASCIIKTTFKIVSNSNKNLSNENLSESASGDSYTC